MLGMRLLRKIWPGLWRDVILNVVISSVLVPIQLRWRLLRTYGLQVSRSRISPCVWFGSSRVTIGEGSFINYGCMFNTTAPIAIGHNCDVGMQVMFATSSHEIGGSDRRAGKATAAPITVEDGCWIGARAVILPGVTVGRGTVVAAGSVVTRNCEPNSVYAGTPARKTRDLNTASGVSQ